MIPVCGPQTRFVSTSCWKSFLEISVGDFLGIYVGSWGIFLGTLGLPLTTGNPDNPLLGATWGYLGLPLATGNPDNPLLGATWGYLGLPLRTGNPGRPLPGATWGLEHSPGPGSAQ